MNAASRLSILTLTVTACSGGSAPTPAEVQAAVLAPTGLTKDGAVDAIAGWAAARDALAVLEPSGTALGEWTGALREREAFRLPELVSTPLGLALRRLEGTSNQAIHDASWPVIGGMNPPAGATAISQCRADIELEIERALRDGGLSGSFDFTIDVDGCSDHALSGSMVHEVRYSLASTEIRQRLQHICQRHGGPCVDGEILGSATASPPALDLAYGWALHYVARVPSTPADMEILGGLVAKLDRTEFNEPRRVLQQLSLVEDAQGQRQSYRLRFSDPTHFSLGGSDGSIDCVLDADGAGSCGPLSWTASELHARWVRR